MIVGSRIHDTYDEGDIQDAFQPGSTPVKNGRRYLGKSPYHPFPHLPSHLPHTLAFNMHGIIYTIDAQTHHNVNVEFHDRSIRPFHFTDHYNFTMGSLGNQGALFACEEVGGVESRVYYRPFDGWAGKGEWSVGFSGGEVVKGLFVCIVFWKRKRGGD